MSASELKPAKTRLATLDFLRAVAILWVFMFHYPWNHSGQSSFGILGNVGWMGVDLFFVLSGYLIGNQIFGSWVNRGSFSLSRFWMRRILRTFPNYLCVLALYFFLPGFAEWNAPLASSGWRFLTFTMNFGLQTGGAGIQAWSLCVEEQFYLIFPVLVLWLFRCNSPRQPAPMSQKDYNRRGVFWMWIILIGVLLLGVVLRGWIWHETIASIPRAVSISSAAAIPVYFTHLYFPTYTRMDGLVFGVMIALIKNIHPSHWRWVSQFGHLYFLLGIFGVCISIYSYRELMLMTGWGVTLWGWPFLDFSFALLVLAGLCPGKFYQWNIPGARQIAMLSYAMYLIHRPMISLTVMLCSAHGIGYQHPMVKILTLLVTLLMSWALYTLVEKPCLRIRDRWFSANPSL